MKKAVAFFSVVILTAGTIFSQAEESKYWQDESAAHTANNNSIVEFSGEFRTGFYIENERIGDQEDVNNGMMKNTDGLSGTNEGLARLNLHVALENIGLRIEFLQESFGPVGPKWAYAYGYGNLFNDQLKISVGLLGRDSPWGTGGSRLRQTLESNNDGGGLVGLRFEYKPFFVPGLNIGVVLNQPDQTINKDPLEQTFGELLQESVIGVAYENKFFDIIFAYRGDSDMDKYKNPIVNEGARFLYSFEEKLFRTLAGIDGMKICLNGYYYGILKDEDQPEFFDNWFYWLYDNENFLAQLEVNFLMVIINNTNANSLIPYADKEFQSLNFFPAFYYKFLNGLLHAGLKLNFGMQFGEGKLYSDGVYQFIGVEPMVQLNISGNAYAALVYNYTDSYANAAGDKSSKHWVNLRAVFSF